MSMSNAHAFVRAGAKFLDNHAVVPRDWRRAVNRDTVNISDEDICTLAQIGKHMGLPDYTYDAMRQFLHLSSRYAREFGFAESDDATNAQLTQAWAVYLTVTTDTAADGYANGDIWYSIEEPHDKIIIGGIFTHYGEYVTYNTTPDHDTADWVTRDVASFETMYNRRPPMVPGALYYSKETGAYYRLNVTFDGINKISGTTMSLTDMAAVPGDIERVTLMSGNDFTITPSAIIPGDSTTELTEG